MIRGGYELFEKALSIPERTEIQDTDIFQNVWLTLSIERWPRFCEMAYNDFFQRNSPFRGLLTINPEDFESKTIISKGELRNKVGITQSGPNQVYRYFKIGRQLEEKDKDGTPRYEFTSRELWQFYVLLQAHSYTVMHPELWKSKWKKKVIPDPEKVLRSLDLMMRQKPPKGGPMGQIR